MNNSSVEAGFGGCELCGDASEAAYYAAQGYSAHVPGVAACQPCAERIANAFHMRHAGQWLTWPNAAPAPKYKKATIDAVLQRRVHERFRYRCVTCGTYLDLTCDHIVPESKGGLTVFENLQTMCRSCNSKKGAAQ